MRGKETELTNYFKKTIFDLGGYAYKIPDDPTPGAFKLARPFDLFATLEKIPIAIEFKWDKKPIAFNPNRLSKNQHDGLRRFEETGALALVGLFVKVGRGDLRLLFWRYNDFKVGGSVKAATLVKMPYIGFKGPQKRFNASELKTTILDLANGFV